MALIKVADRVDKDYSDLKTDVLLLEQRRQALEDRAGRIEAKLRELEQEKTDNRKLIFGAAVTIAAGIITTIFSILINFNGH
jgi:predicted  nucleic acid-binding Zn-ribbon protein